LEGWLWLGADWKKREIAREGLQFAKRLCRLDFLA
jgi:hypothetical protein